MGIGIKKLICKNYSLYIVLIMILIYTVLFSYYTIMKHYTFQTAAYDLGIFLNSFYNTLHEGRFFYTTLWEGSRFQNHYSPILFAILPIYEIFPRVETLLIIQSFILAIGALPIYWIAKNEISKKAGIAFAFLYLIYPALAGINKFDFHEVAFAPAFLLFAFHYYKQKSYNLTSLFIGLALISREDVAMVVIPMAMLWLWDIRKPSIKDKDTFFCVSIIFAGLMWFLITTRIIIPYYNPVEGYWFIRDYRPENIFLDLNKKIEYIVDIFLPLLFIPLLNKLILITIPIFARNLFSTKITRLEINNQNQALLVPFVFLSSIYFVKQVSENLNEPIKSLFSKRLTYPGLAICLIISFFVSPIPMEISKNSIIPKLVAIPYNGPSPIQGILPITPHDKALNQVIDIIPENASLYAQSNLFPHVADRPKVYYVSGDSQIFKGWNNPQIGSIVPWGYATDFDYILVDDGGKPKSVLRNTDVETLDKISQNYGIYAAIDQIYLFKKGYNNGANNNESNNNGANNNESNNNGVKANLLQTLSSSFDNQYIKDYYNGIIVSYYNNNNISGYPVVTDRVSNINFLWKNPASPIPGVINNVNFSAKFEGYIYIPVNSSYIFQIFSDDGSRLYIDDRLIIDSWEISSAGEYYRINLDVGLHKIRVDYRQKINQASISLYWYVPWKGIFEIVPNEYFYIPKENTDNIYNGGNVYIETMMNNGTVNNSKMKNDNTATIY